MSLSNKCSPAIHLEIAESLFRTNCQLSFLDQINFICAAVYEETRQFFLDFSRTCFAVQCIVFVFGQFRVPGF